MKNIDIRVRVADSKLTYKQIAEEMGVTPVYLSRLMAKELNEKTRTRILNAINTLEEKSLIGGK